MLFEDLFVYSYVEKSRKIGNEEVFIIEDAKSKGKTALIKKDGEIIIVFKLDSNIKSFQEFVSNKLIKIGKLKQKSKMVDNLVFINNFLNSKFYNLLLFIDLKSNYKQDIKNAFEQHKESIKNIKLFYKISYGISNIFKILIDNGYKILAITIHSNAKLGRKIAGKWKNENNYIYLYDGKEMRKYRIPYIKYYSTLDKIDVKNISEADEDFRKILKKYIDKRL